MTAKEAKNIALWNQLPRVLREKIQLLVDLGYVKYFGSFTEWAKKGEHNLLFDDFKPENWKEDKRRHTYAVFFCSKNMKHQECYEKNSFDVFNQAIVEFVNNEYK